jgi:uncharacterized membrane protein YdjX (TVP38/TMEM64 family)
MENNNIQKNKFITIAKFALLLVFVIGIPVYLYFFHNELITSFRSLDEVKDFLLRNEAESILIYLGLQILHIVVAIIPGQPFHIASGFVFGFWFGYALSTAGIVMGSIITFYLSRILGKDAMYLFFGEKKFTKFLNLVNSKKGIIIIFLIYFIPGLPKEGLGYVVGLSKIKLLPFLLIAVIGRTPALMVSVVIGSMYDHDSFTGIIIISSIAVILCVFAVVYRKKIMTRLNESFDKIAKGEPQ